MINEKMLELLLLDKILKEFNPRDTFTFTEKNHDYNMIRDRYKTDGRVLRTICN